MVNLIGNEIKKIFSRVSVYIIIILAIVLMVANLLVNKFLDDEFYTVEYNIDEDIQWYESYIKNLDPEMETEEYILAHSQLDLYKLQKEYQNEEEWKFECISNNAYDYIAAINAAKYSKNSNKEQLEKAENAYNKFLHTLENNDWRAYTKDLLEIAKLELNQSKQALELATKADKQELEKVVEAKELEVETLEIRLNKNIPYDGSYMDNALETYGNSMYTLIMNNEEDSGFDLNGIKEQAMIAKYVIDTGKEVDSDDNAGALLKDFIDIEDILLILNIIIIAGSIISDEFSKGTIKQLLVRPYSRIKIWFAKYLTTIIVTIILMIIITLIATIVYGIFMGFDGYANYSVGVYDFDAGNAYSMNVFAYIGIKFISKLSYFIMLATIAIFVGTILNNTAMAVAVPLLGMVASSIIEMLLAYYEKFRFLKYFITPNWNLSVYDFGRPSSMKFLSFEFSLTIYLVYLVVLIGLSVIKFKKQDIKNI